MNAASVSRAQTPRLRDEARSLYRNAILNAAEEVFAERGFFSARIQDIAERGRFAVGTVYKHFEQKEDVLRALLAERSGAMEIEISAREDDPPGFEDKLVARLARLFAYVERHRAFYRIALENGLFGVVSASAGAPLHESSERKDRRAKRAPIEKERAKIAGFKQAMLDLVAEGIDEGVLTDAEPGLLASLLFGAVRAFTLGAFELGDSPEAKATVIVDLFLHGARRRTNAERQSRSKLSGQGKTGQMKTGPGKKSGGRERNMRK